MRKNSLRKQNKHLLWLLMDFVIARYLLSNIRSRASGVEKAERHLELSSIFVASKLICSVETAKYDNFDVVMKIHDATQKLTGHLDTEIGFDVNGDCPENLSDLEFKFFNRFLELAEEEWEKIIFSAISNQPMSQKRKM